MLCWIRDWFSILPISLSIYKGCGETTSPAAFFYILHITGAKMKNIFIMLLVICTAAIGQTPRVPSYYREDKALSKQLEEIASRLELNKGFYVGEDRLQEISLAVIDLSGLKPEIAGVKMDNFIYPASVYKMYVAAEVLHQVYEGKYSLETPFMVKQPNNVDKAKEIKSDPRPLLKDGDTVSVNYLLDLMITRSDNSAANCLIDLAKRENINALMASNGWKGSEVTRKFLKRKFEDAGYDTVRGTMTCALHAADFMYRVENNKLVNPWVSMQMKALLGRQLDDTKLSRGLPKGAMFYHKTGWFSYWTNDVGIIDDGKKKYVVACFLPIEEDTAREKMRLLASEIHKLMSRR